MNKYTLHVEDFDMYRQPQTRVDLYQVDAPTAADAITIGQLRHNFPYTWVPEKTGDHDHRCKTRKLVDITIIGGK
jgi:hypothetical protein